MDLLRNIFKGDKVVWIIFLCLCLISVVEVFSASSTLVYKSGDHWGPIKQHSIFLGVGALVVIVFHSIPHSKFRYLSYPLLLFSGVCLLLLLAFDHLNIAGLLVIEKVNEAGRWIRLFGVQFQPSEFAKMAVIIATALNLARGQGEEGLTQKAFKYIMVLAGGTCVLILPENYSTAALLFCTIYLMLFIGRLSMRMWLLLGGGIGGVGALFVAFLLLTPNPTLEKIPMGHRFTTVKSRIADFARRDEIPPAKFDIDGDAQVAHARIAVASSHFIGKGPGNSVQRDFLSQAFSDFIYAIIIEELGLAGGIFVVALYLWLLIRVGRIARKCDHNFPAFLVLGIGLLLVIQAMFNMMVAVGVVPVTGQPLPLISRGGTSTIINCVYIGMILSVSRYTAQLEELKRHDAQIPLLVSTGQPEEAVSEACTPESEAGASLENGRAEGN